jgi:hypothetical protein
MFLKLFMIIVVVGALACALLVIRQQRIEAAHEMSLIHRRLTEGEQTLWKLRSEVAVACRPDVVQRMVKRHGGEWMAIPAPRPAAVPHDDGASAPRVADARCRIGHPRVEAGS